MVMPERTSSAKGDIKMLNVGVDYSPLSGVGRYTRELLSLLTEVQDVHWFLYCD